MSKIIIPVTNTYSAKESSELLSPLESENPEEIVNGNIGDNEIYDSTTDDVSPGDIVVEEDYVELTTDEVLEDVGTIDSDDEFDLHGN